MPVWEAIAPMVVAVVMFLTIGGVLILRPIAKHLGAYLEALTRQQLEGDRNAELNQLRDILETIDQRLHLLEERQDFNDRLLHAQDRDAARTGKLLDSGRGATAAPEVPGRDGSG